MNELEKRIEEVKKEYSALPKSHSDEGDFVIIAEKDDSIPYEEYKECLGVNSKGELIWSYLSGCSCRGRNDNKVVTDITAKIFEININDTVEIFYNNNKIEPYEASYTSY